MMNKADRTYNVNIKRLALLTLPTWLRRPLAGALIYAGVRPLGRLLQELRAYRSATSYRLRHNGQVCKLRGVLNDLFDPGRRRISLTDSEDGATTEIWRVWHRGVGQWAIVPLRGMGAISIHREGFGGTSGYDFWVNLPEDLKGSEIRLRAVVNMYKLAGKRFAINYK